MITWITENVAIGEYADAVNELLLEKEKIDCILSVTVISSLEETSVLDRLGIPYFHVQVGRHQGLEPVKIELRTAAYMLEQLIVKYKRILVHCTAGIDRAPFVVAYWMMKNRYDSCFGEFDEEYKREWMLHFYEFIKGKRPQVIEHMEWI